MEDSKTTRGVIVMYNGDRRSLVSLMSVKLLFNRMTINKSLLSLQRQKRSSLSASID